MPNLEEVVELSYLGDIRVGLAENPRKAPLAREFEVPYFSYSVRVRILRGSVLGATLWSVL